MSITLYEMAHSPFCIPVAQALQFCNVDFNRVEIPNWDRSEILRLTNGAYYQVPVLVDNGRILFESGADTQDVARHVDAKYAGGALFPKPLEGLQAIVLDFIEDQLEAVTFRLVDPAYIAEIADLAARGMVIRHKERKFGRGCVEQWRADAPELRARADALLERFETTLAHSPFLLGEKPVYCDFALLGILGNLTFRAYNTLGPRQAALGAWVERMEDARLRQV